MNDAPVLAVQNVSKHFGGVQALNRVSLEVFPGEVLGLVGDNGAGKTTLIKVISGVYRPDEGEIRYKGAPVQLRNPSGARGLGIETIYQDLALADNLDVGANVFLGREPQKRLFGLLPAIDRKHMRDAARDVLDTLDIGIEADKLTQPVGTLSGGQRQAVAISRALLPSRRIVFSRSAGGPGRVARRTDGSLYWRCCARRRITAHVSSAEIAISTSEASPASPRNPSAFAFQMRVASVSNPIGEASRVAGSSFIVESITSPAPAASAGSISGSSTRQSRRRRPTPSVRPASSSRLSMPATPTCALRKACAPKWMT